MSKTNTSRRIEVLKEWLAQMEREGKTFQRYRKTVKSRDEDELPFKRE